MRSEQRSSRSLAAAATLVAVIVAFGLAAPASAAPSCTTSPSISSVVPAFGTVLGGTSVVINGTGFCSTGLKVWFGANKVSNANVSFVSSTEVDVTTPASAAVGPVTVRVQQTTQSKTKQSRLVNGFTYTCDGCTVSPVSVQYEGVDPAQQTTEPNGVLEPGESAVAIKTTVLDSSGVTETNVTGAVDTTDNVGLSGPQNGASDIVYHMDDGAATYGTITSGASADCGSDCYAATVTIGGSGNRPTGVTDWDATMTETPSVNGTGTTPIDWRIHVGKTFSDVSKSTNIFYDYVERLVHNKVTLGFGNGTFQPNGNAPRNQMAAFISRAFAGGDANVPDSGTISGNTNANLNGSYNCTSGGTSLFADVLPTDTFCKHIHYLAGINVTAGCDANNPPDYCQNTNVTRAIMAVFISRALVPGLGDAGVPDSNTGTGPFATRTYDCTNGPSPFLDVPLGGTCKNIGYIWTLGIVDGDGAGHFQPGALVTRGQMSKFLDNAFTLTLAPE